MRAIALTIVGLSTVFLLGMINSGHAISIEELRSSNVTHVEYDTHVGYDDGDPYFTFYVRTDKPYDKLIWYVYDSATEETRRIDSTEGDGVRKDHYFSISYLPGAPTGRKYVISVLAQKEIDGWMSFNTANYDFTVYTFPKTRTKYGNWTMATMSGSVNIAWNGTRAEAEVSGSIKDNMGRILLYGMSIGYKVIRLTPLGHEADVLECSNKPILVGFIQANSDNHDDSANDYYSDDYTLPNGGVPGERYRVEARVEITAQYPDGDPNEQDVLPVIDQADISIPRN